MITLRRIKPLLRSWPFRLAICVLFLLLLASIFYHANENSALKPRNSAFDYSLTDESGNTALLVVLIMTGPDNSERRQAIRDTWLSFDAREGIMYDVRHYFVIGVKNLPGDAVNKLQLEQKLHQDLLLLGDFEDAYAKLTEKLGLSMEWLNVNFNFEFVLKADDDTYARLDKIVYELKYEEEKQKAKNLYWGYFYGKGTVKKSGVWKETNWKLCDYYLPYARGGGYVLSRNLVRYVANNWRDFESYLSEDVSMGAWLAPLKLTRLHDPRFDTEYKSRGCKNSFIVSHKQTTEDMRQKFQSVRTTGELCVKEVTLFHGYIYNWNVPPSQCCVRSEKVP